MKKGIGMIINCDECGTRHEIPNDKLDDYNIYWVSAPKTAIGYRPKLLCSKCTKKFVLLADRKE